MDTAQERTSLTISLTVILPKAFSRSPCLATSPLDTFTKTLLICRTSSKFVSLRDVVSLSVQMSGNIGKLTLHCAIPVLYFCSRQSITQLQSGSIGANETFDPDLESFATFLKTNDRNICKSVPETSLEAQNNDADGYHLIWFDG